MNVEQRAGDDARHGQRPGDRAERRDGRRVQVRAGLQEPGVQPLQGREDRQHHERQEVVGQAADHRERRRRQPGVRRQQVQAVQGRHDEGVVGQDLLPRDGAQDEAGEERRDDQHEQHALQELAAPGAHRDDVRHRVADDQRGDGGQEREPERAQQRRARTGRARRRSSASGTRAGTGPRRRRAPARTATSPAARPTGHDEEQDQVEQARPSRTRCARRARRRGARRRRPRRCRRARP